MTGSRRLGRTGPFAPRMGAGGFRIQIRVNFTDVSGFGLSPGRMLNNEIQARQAAARRSLDRAAAYARGVMKRGQRKGRKNKLHTYDHINAKWRVHKNIEQRKPSAPGKPPNFHVPRGHFSFKYWIRFARVTGDEEYSRIIGPEYQATAGSRKTQAPIDKLMERGGRTKVLLPDMFDDNALGWDMWRKLVKAKGKRPLTWKPASYPSRPFAEPALAPTARMFNEFFIQDTREL